MKLKRVVLGFAAVVLYVQFGCPSGKLAATENPWPDYPPEGSWKGVDNHSSGYWWMPSKIGPEKGTAVEPGNKGVIFYSGEITPSPPPPVAEVPRPAEPKVVERITYKAVPVKKEVRADRYIFPTITFDEGSADLKLKDRLFDEKTHELIISESQIEYAAELIKQSCNSVVFVEGNIDSAEAPKFAELGQTRAEAVEKDLVQLGVKPNTLMTKDYGASKPLASSSTEAGRELNRRVSFTVVPCGVSLEPEKLVQPPAPEVGPGVTVVEKVVEKEVAVPDLVITDHFIFANINFEYDKALLTREGLENTKKAAEVFKVAEQLKSLSIEGHCDSQGSDAYNEELSMRRANTIKNKMVELDMPASDLVEVAYGERRPLVSNDTALGMALNRRVEFKPQYK